MVEFLDPPVTHSDAKAILAAAYENVFGVYPDHSGHLFALGIAQSIGLMEGGGYGVNFHNNWGAITAPGMKDGVCPPGTFAHKDSSSEGEYVTCFRAYETSQQGAEDLLRVLYVQRPEVYEYALAGDIRNVAREMYASNYYLGTAPADQKDENGDYTNVNRYVDFILRGMDDIVDLYEPESPSAGDSSALPWVLGGAIALVGVVAVAKR